MEHSPKRLSREKARERILRYCAYQERCHREVKEKLYSFGLGRQDVEELMTELITDGFLNEERFARAFAGGRFRMKKWGRIRIIHALNEKGLTKNCISLGMEEIPDEEYTACLRDVIEKKWLMTHDPDVFVRREKVANFAINRGFEPELVWQVAKSLA